VSIQHFRPGLTVPLLALAIVFSMVLVATPAYSGGCISHPHGTIIEVASGENFLLRYRLYWNEPGWDGAYGVNLTWYNYGNKPEENLTFLSARAYFDNNENITTDVTLSSFPSGADTGWTLTLDSTGYFNPNDDNFTVDIWMRASGTGNKPHKPTDNHPISCGGLRAVTVFESGIVDIPGTETPITIRVLGRGVSVSISPYYQSGPNGTTLTYTVTVNNTGSVPDNYVLTVSDNAGWGDNIWLDDNQFLNVPQGENRTTTLRVRIPGDATGCTEDNIWVKATSQGDNTVSDNDSCIAHVTIARGVQVLIAPPSQENENGGTLAYTVTVKNTGNVQENFQLTKGDNAGWALILDNDWLLVPKGENRTTRLTVNIPSNARGCTWDNIWVKATSNDNAATFDNKSCLAHVRVVRGVDVSISPSYLSGLPWATLDYTVTVANTGNAEDIYDLMASDDAGWSSSTSPTSLTIPPWENRTATLNVTVPPSAIGCTEDNITVTATSQGDPSVKDNASCVAHAAIVRGVDVSISPSYKSGLPGAVINYTVTVINTGNVLDNYALTVGDNEDWSPMLNDNLFENVTPGENKQTTLRVTIPENAVPCTEDNVIVTAAGTGVTDSGSCIAHAAFLGVDVSISPQYMDGSPGSTLNYTVIVKNTGAIDDNYYLTASDNAGWGPTVSPTSLTVPAGENRTSTLSVTIHENALGCTRDNIAVTATSQTDNTVSASDTCVAHAVEVLTEIRTVIYPTADIYAFGEYGIGYSRTQLKFDISGIPLHGRILSAKLWLYRLAADGWDGGVTLNRVDNQLWSENITANQFDAQTLTNEETHAGKFTSRGWGYLDVPSQLNVDYGAGNAYSSFRLRWANDNGSKPSVGIDDGRFLVINSELNELCIIFSSSEYNGSDPYLEVVYVPPYAVSVSISPIYKSGLPGEELSYTVRVTNMGNLDDNYVLTVSDNTGWGPAISPTPLAVASGTSGEATLTVTVPENVTPCTQDNITVTATSQWDNTVSDNASCIAHGIKAEFKLVTLYKVGLDLNTYLWEGSKLVVKFYKYDNSYQTENVIWSGSTPAHIEENKIISHPRASERYPWGTLQKVKLVLTTDDTENVISTIASLTVTKPMLADRYLRIKLEYIAPGANKPVLADEYLTIKIQFIFAPS